ncbi:unnamed protein product [Prunus armeniaca]
MMWCMEWLSKVEYIVNGNQYHLGYYLADGIYSRWATLVKTISSPDNPKKRLFAQMQEVYKKDVERAFGILQPRWPIVWGLHEYVTRISCT